MGERQKKRFFSKHAKSSALVMSVGVHAVLLVGALSLVAVSVVLQEEATFETKKVERPQMSLRKLQVPINVKKVKQRPKLRKQIISKPKVNSVPDFKLPEVVGVKGGLGGVSGGLGGGASLGFAMPEINIFGAKSSGEKIFIALDSSHRMMVDEMGGVHAYEIIKAELVRILGGLNSTVLFNVAVYDPYSAKMLFPTMVPASAENVEKVAEWLRPLNQLTANRGSQDDYGSKTTGPGGVGVESKNQVKPLGGDLYWWGNPMLRAMHEEADAVFVLASSWGFLAYELEAAAGWSDAKEKRYQEKLKEAKAAHKKESADRVANGGGPRIIASDDYDRKVVLTYFPGEPVPPHATYHLYTPKEVVQAALNTRAKSRPGKTAAGLKGGRRAKKDTFSLNVVHFSEEGAEKDENFLKLTRLTHGAYRMIQGEKAIRGYEHGAGE